MPLDKLVSDMAVDVYALFVYFITAINDIFLFFKTIYKNYRCGSLVPANRCFIEGMSWTGAWVRGQYLVGPACVVLFISA